ncbi:MAG: helix-turn-helix domain-containing protein [Oscillospiraceae bacterium]|jgi:transcriptional regulator with XRE-family HTH domain|nr:helix-turn-helix domain-containing protein [Oscillospiraceae bacterium]
MHYRTIIRELRIKNRLTQQQLADFMHIDRSTYAYYETGRSKMEVELLIQLARFYQVSLPFILGQESPVSALADSGGESDAFQFMLEGVAERFNELSRQERQLLMLFRSSGKKKEILQAVLEAAKSEIQADQEENLASDAKRRQ